MKKLLAVCSIAILSLTIAPVFTHQGNAYATVAPSQLFKYANTFDEVKNLVMTSLEKQKPVLIEFYANWCTYCQAADRDVFSDPAVQASMEKITAIRVDASTGDPEQTNIMQSYKVNGFPSFVAYDKQGNIMNTPFQGGVTKEAMLQLLETMNK